MNEQRLPIGKLSIYHVGENGKTEKVKEEEFYKDKENETFSFPDDFPCPCSIDHVDFSPYAKGKKVADAVRFILKSTEIKEVVIRDNDADVEITYPNNPNANKFLDCLGEYEVEECLIYPDKMLLVNIKAKAPIAPKKKPTPKKK